MPKSSNSSFNNNQTLEEYPKHSSNLLANNRFSSINTGPQQMDLINTMVLDNTTTESNKKTTTLKYMNRPQKTNEISPNLTSLPH